MKKGAALCAVVVLCALGSSTARAAELGFSPATISIALAQGASGSALVSGAVNNPPTTPLAVSFVLRPAGGTMPTSWLIPQPSTLTPNAKSVLVPLVFRVPANAAAGVYNSTLRPTVLSSSGPLTPSTSSVSVTLTVASKCSTVPVLTVSAFGPTEFNPPNNKMENVSFTGKVTLPGGCVLKRVWYTMTDEYDEHEGTGELAVGSNGQITHTFPIMVSRRGSDKDGRLYQISIFAEDDAGVGTTFLPITVGHDQRGGK